MNTSESAGTMISEQVNGSGHGTVITAVSQPSPNVSIRGLNNVITSTNQTLVYLQASQIQCVIVILGLLMFATPYCYQDCVDFVGILLIRRRVTRSANGLGPIARAYKPQLRNRLTGLGNLNRPSSDTHRMKYKSRSCFSSRSLATKSSPAPAVIIRLFS